MVQSRVAMVTKTKPASFWQNIPFKGYFYASLVLNLLTVLCVIAVRNFLPPISPLLYGRPEGASQLVPTLWLILTPAVALALTVLNLFLTRIVKDLFMQQILITSAFLVSLLSTITILKIIFLVGFF